MNQKKIIYILTAMVIVLILLNMTMVGFMFFKDRQQCRNPEFGRGKGDYLIEKLKFTPEQITKFDVLREDHHLTVMPLNKEIMEQKKQFFALINESKVDSLKVDSLSKVITEMHRKVDIATFYHFKKIREICTAEQQVKFQNLIEEGLFQPGQERGPMRHARE
jgi:periplasmic protein CpxP/Spy